MKELAGRKTKQYLRPSEKKTVSVNLDENTINFTNTIRSFPHTCELVSGRTGTPTAAEAEGGGSLQRKWPRQRCRTVQLLEETRQPRSLRSRTQPRIQAAVTMPGKRPTSQTLG